MEPLTVQQFRATTAIVSRGSAQQHYDWMVSMSNAAAETKDSDHALNAIVANVYKSEADRFYGLMAGSGLTLKAGHFIITFITGSHE